MKKEQKDKRTPEQNRKIWVLAGELGFDEGLLRDLVERLTGQRSTSVLTVTQANGLIEEMNRLSGKQPTASTRRSGMGTPEQLHKIRSLVRELGWADDPTRLKGFMRKYCGGVVRLEWLQFGQARSLIEAMKGVKRSQERQQQGVKA